MALGKEKRKSEVRRSFLRLSRQMVEIKEKSFWFCRFY
jgi:hypothetical protein